MSHLVLEGISKRFGTFQAVDELHLQIAQGEWFSLLGPSGCGKTTTLRMIAGFVRPDTGRVFLKGKDITHVPPYRRNTGMVFQNYALFPHLTVYDNVAYGLRVRRIDEPQVRKRVHSMLELVRLSELASRYPRQLSGGQQQRVALARALAIQPDILLLDEPLSNLDARLREDLRTEISQIQRRLGITTVYVTHDQEEALSMSDRIAVINQGRVEQLDQPKAIYEQPATRFVADFIGKINIFKGIIISATADLAEVAVEIGQEQLSLPIAVTRVLQAHTPVAVAVRPERIGLFLHREATDVIAGIVDHVAFFGKEIHYRIRVGGVHVLVLDQNYRDGQRYTLGQQVFVSIRADDCYLLTDQNM